MPTGNEYSVSVAFASTIYAEHEYDVEVDVFIHSYKSDASRRPANFVCKQDKAH